MTEGHRGQGLSEDQLTEHWNKLKKADSHADGAALPQARKRRCYHDRYFARVKWNDLHEAKKEYHDPFSLENFLDLIRDSCTLPALLYTVDASLSPALLYD